MDQVEQVFVNCNASQVRVNTFFEIDEWSSSANVLKAILGNVDTPVVDVLEIEQVAILEVVSHRCVPDDELIPCCHQVHEIAEWRLLSILVILLSVPEIVVWDIDPSWTSPIGQVYNHPNVSVFLIRCHCLVA